MGILTKLIVSLFCLYTLACSNKQEVNTNPVERQVIDFNFDWKFTLTDKSSAYMADYDDSDWRDVRLPHDWSIEAEYTQKDTAGATGYLPGGQAWYRKTFDTPNVNGKTQILFDGIYNHSKVWINGHLLGERPSGYTAFHHDLTPYLNADGKNNVLAVFVDHSRYVDSRWYTGSGIYRNVKLFSTNKTHIPIWGSYVTTPEVSAKQAALSINTIIQTQPNLSQDLTVLSQLQDSEGQTIASVSSPLTLANKPNARMSQTLVVDEPKLWSPESPTLYSVVTTLKVGDRTIDSNQVTTGFRFFSNDPKKGFFLNGKATKIKGVNIHHDGGLVGAAVPKGVWKRRLQTLKEAGVNAIRTAHNPASKEFLDLCDEMGFLVQAEAFDEWDNPKDKRKNFNQEGKIDYITQSYSQYFAQWAERDLRAMLLRDRNHPSIFQWSIGNEIEWTYPRYTHATGYWEKQHKHKHNYYWDQPPYTQNEILNRFKQSPVNGPELAKTAANLAKWTRELDTSRPITANLVTPSISHTSGYADVLDVVGYSYRQAVYELGHKHYPDKMILGTENWVQWHEWQAVLDKPYIAGIFVWTGISYLGESNGRWPKKGSSSGMLDFAGWAKPSYHMMKSVWSDTPHLYMATQSVKDSPYKIHYQELIEKPQDAWKHKKWGWHKLNQHWNYQDGENVAVEIYTNQPQVELFLNNKSLGVKYLKDNPDRILKWLVPYSTGELRAKAVDSSIETNLKTAGNPVGLILNADKNLLTADGYDVAHITAQLVDKDGQPVKHVNKNIEFIISEHLTNLGVDNGATDNIQKHKTNQIVTAKGRALLIVQSKLDMAKGTVKATIDGKTYQTLDFSIK